MQEINCLSQKRMIITFSFFCVWVIERGLLYFKIKKCLYWDTYSPLICWERERFLLFQRFFIGCLLLTLFFKHLQRSKKCACMSEEINFPLKFFSWHQNLMFRPNFGNVQKLFNFHKTWVKGGWCWDAPYCLEFLLAVST